MTKKVAALVDKFKKNERDTGSVEVQVITLTDEINQLHVHCETNPKDFSSGRGMMQKVNQRKQFLSYLRRTNSAAYKGLIKELGLRK